MDSQIWALSLLEQKFETQHAEQGQVSKVFHFISELYDSLLN